MSLPTATAVTVVIPALNAAATLGDQLCALGRQEEAPPFSVIVVDNGSDDATAAVAHSYATPRLPVSVVHQPERGINHARNAGIAAADDGIILLCDADDRVGTTWVARLTANIGERTWAAGCALVVPAAGQPTEPLWRHGQIIRPTVDEPYFDRTLGGSCGFTTAMWEAVGGFDPHLNGPGDEHEFFMRAHAAGYRPVVVDDAVIDYVRRGDRRDWLRYQYTKGVHNSITARRDGGTALSVVCRPSSVAAQLCRTLLSAPLHLRPRDARWRWLGRTAVLAGQLTGWVRSR